MDKKEGQLKHIYALIYAMFPSEGQMMSFILTATLANADPSLIPRIVKILEGMPNVDLSGCQQTADQMATGLRELLDTYDAPAESL